MKKRFKRVVALLLSAVMLIGTGTIAFAQTADEAAELSKKTAEQVEAEGLVMLKNEDDILPLKGKKVNVFGTASANPFYGGGGSGAINGDNAASFYSALEAAGISYNKELAKIYSNYAEKNSMNWSEIFSGGLMAMFVKLVGGQMSRIEMPVKDISCRTLRAAKKYSDTAIIFIGRAGLESEDLDESDLRLNDAEKAMVDEDGVITLQDVYRDESLWDKFLDQLTVSEMIELIGDCAYQSPANEKYGIPSTYDNDGTANVKGAGGFLYKDAGVAYPTETVCAQTWNDELIEKMGAAIGKEAVSLGTDYLYAPACNMHRSPMGGRNFEYYSEDPLLSGKMAAAFTRGAQSEKLLVTVKHFALNDQETARMGIHVWSNEQAIREIYCKPFEIAVKEGGAKGIMSAFNRLGTKWCGGTPELLVDLLRNEWGFDVMVITDAYTNLTGYGYMDPVLAVYARNNELLCMLWSVRKITLSPSMMLAYKNDPIGFGTALRDCTKGILKNKMPTKAFLETV